MMESSYPNMEAPHSRCSQVTLSTEFVEIEVTEEPQHQSESNRSVEKRDMEKYIRQRVFPSSSSGGEHHRHLSAHDHSWIQDTIRESVDSAMNKIEQHIKKSIEDKFIPKIKKWFEFFLGKVQCGCSHSTDTYIPISSAMSYSTIGDNDQEQQPGPDVPNLDIPRDNGHIESTDPTLQTPQDSVVPLRYSLQIPGTSFGATLLSHDEKTARHFMSGLDLLGELTSQNVNRHVDKPMQQKMKQELVVHRDGHTLRHSAALKSSYVNSLIPRPIPPNVGADYEHFLARLNATVVLRNSEKFVDLYMMHMRTRLIGEIDLLDNVDCQNTTILDSPFFRPLRDF